MMVGILHVDTHTDIGQRAGDGAPLPRRALFQTPDHRARDRKDGHSRRFGSPWRGRAIPKQQMRACEPQ